MGARHANPRERGAWREAVDAGSPSIGAEEILDRDAAMAETCFLGLRCAEGLDVAAFEAEFGVSPRDRFAPAIDRFLADGLLEASPDGCLALTRRGRMLADTVCAEFV